MLSLSESLTIWLIVFSIVTVVSEQFWLYHLRWKCTILVISFVFWLYHLCNKAWWSSIGWCANFQWNHYSFACSRLWFSVDTWSVTQCLLLPVPFWMMFPTFEVPKLVGMHVCVMFHLLWYTQRCDCWVNIPNNSLYNLRGINTVCVLGMEDACMHTGCICMRVCVYITQTLCLDYYSLAVTPNKNK